MLSPYVDLAKNILTSNVQRLDFPYKLTFVTTYWCNYRCKTCNIWQRKPENELSLEEIQKFFQKSNGFNWIDFTGGEVWIRKDFPDIVEAALDHCKNLVLVHFPTNGYMTDQIVAGVERILKKKPRKLIVTISTDGDEQVNDEVRGKKGGWRKQIETYKQLHAMPGVDVVLGMTLSSLNADQYDKAFAAAKAECPWLKPADYHINVVHASSHYYGNEELPALQGKKKEIAEQVRRYRIERGVPKSCATPSVTWTITSRRCAATRSRARCSWTRGATSTPAVCTKPRSVRSATSTTICTSCGIRRVPSSCSKKSGTTSAPSAGRRARRTRVSSATCCSCRTRPKVSCLRRPSPWPSR
jgi:MoaA/NifB/PqqE/SkfB family radical SAM enzyme